MHDTSEFPTELPPVPGEGGGLAWTATILGVTALLLALFNAGTLDDWVGERTPSPRVAQLAALSGRWRAETDALHLGAPRAALHAVWKRLEAAGRVEER